MSKLNTKPLSIHTHEGAKAKQINPIDQLRRSVMSCMLWEKEFYEDGQSIADRIVSLVPKVDAESVSSLAIEARTKMKLRHIPLLLACEMAKYNSHKHLVSSTLAEIIQRPDELAEFLALYWREGKRPLSGQIKKGLSRAFNKFDAYQLAKYNRDAAVKLRDVLFLCHAKPKDSEQDALWKKLINGKLEPPDTWEVALSSGTDKKTSWEKLLKENKLGALALLRNLRNMKLSDVDEGLILYAITNMKVEKVLPFRFISAARFAPQWEELLEKAMLKCLSSQEKLQGRTVLLIDVSGSMDSNISLKSDMTRLDAACGIGILLREICEKVDIFTFSDKLIQIPARRGFALRDAIIGSQLHSGTPLGLAIRAIYSNEKISMSDGWSYRVEYEGQNLHPDRLIVITDEQSCDKVSDPESRGYMINIASNQNGVGYGKWHHIDGWSEAVIDYLREYEKAFA